MELFTDENIIAGIKCRDNSILEYVYREYFPQFKWTLINDLLLTEDDAKDIFQNAMISIYTNIKKDDFILNCSFKTYLFTICKNIIRNRLKFEYGVKSRKFEKGIELDELIDTNDVNYDIGSLKSEEENVIEIKEHLFRKYFFELRADCQKILRMFFDERPYDEIAITMGYKREIFARKKKQRCKEYLTNMIKKDNLYQQIKNYKNG